MKSLSQLLTFMNVLETRNFNRTAERMNITQSTVSSRMRQLEIDLGARLFERGRGGAEPTKAGRKFEVHCRTILAVWGLAQREVQQNAGELTRSMHLSAQFSLSNTVLLECKRLVQQETPNLLFYLESNFSEQIKRDILTGKSDLGIVFAPELLPDLAVTEFGSEYYLMVSTCANDLSAVDLNTYIKVVYTDYFERHHDEFYPELSAPPTRVGSEHLAIDVLKSYGGTAFLPRFAYLALQRELPNLKIVSGAEIIPQPLYFMCHVRKRHDPFIKKCQELIAQVVNQGSIDKVD